jgi:hypothetical protein
MGSSLRWARARRLVLAGSAVAGTLVLAAGAAPAGATVEKSVNATYSCTATALGKTYTYAGTIAVSGVTPAKVAAKSLVSMTGWQITVTVPASIVNKIYPYTHTVSGTLGTFDIVSTDNAGTVNAAAPGIKFGPLTLKQNTPLVATLPRHQRAGELLAEAGCRDLEVGRLSHFVRHPGSPKGRLGNER